MQIQNYCPAQPADDVLSEILRDLRLARASYGRSEFTAPWGVEIPYKEGVRFHFVVEGSCWMRSEAQEPILLEAGDVLLLPHGTGHVIADHPSRPPRPLEHIGPRLIGNSSYRLAAGVAASARSSSVARSGSKARRRTRYWSSCPRYCSFASRISMRVRCPCC